jgi:hypothetical protein
MFEALDVHARTNYQYLITADESRMMYGQMPSKMWVPDQGHVDAILRLSHQSRKATAVVFFGVNGRDLVKILPEGTKLTSEYFKDRVLQKIYHGSHSSWQLAVGG